MSTKDIANFIILTSEFLKFSIKHIMIPDNTVHLIHTCGKGDHQICTPFLYGRLPETRGGVRNGDQGVSGAFHGRGRPLRSVRHTEKVVSVRVRAGAQPLPDVYGEGQGVIPDPLSGGGSTPPWPGSGNTRIPVQGE